MKNSILAIVFLIVIIGGFLILYQNRSAEQSTPVTGQENQQTDTTQKWESQTDEQGQISVTVTPQTLSGAQWKFRIVFDTHSGNLDDDPLQVTVLVDNKGNTYQATAWEGQGPGDHHREGVLIFNVSNPALSFITLKIRNVGGVPDRSFKWNIE